MIANAVTFMLLLQSAFSQGMSTKSISSPDSNSDSDEQRSLLNEDSLMPSFKRIHDVKQDAVLDVVGVSDVSNSIIIHGNEYSLDDMTPVDLYAEGATISMDGKEQEASLEVKSVMMKKQGSETVLVTTNSNDDIDTIDIIGDDGSDVYLAAVIPGVAFATIEDKDLDPAVLNRMHLSGDDGNAMDYRVPEGRRNLRKGIQDKWKKQMKMQPHESDNIQEEEIEVHRSLQTSCPSYNVIEVAVSFDSTLCSKRGGFSKAKAEVEKIVARASALYGSQGVCAKLKISHLEGFCSSSSDPYRRSVNSGNIGCGGEGVLDAYQDYWRRNKSGVHRDVSHLFFEQDVGNSIGCAYVGTLCSKDWGYGVNDISFSRDLNQWTAVFAHELGHNTGMNHISDSSRTNVMNDSIGSGVHTWSNSAVNHLRTNLPRNACISKEVGPSPPSPSPPSDTTRCYLRTHHGTYLRFDKYNRDNVDQASWMQTWEQFEIIQKDGYAVVKSLAHGTYLRFGRDRWEVNQQTYIGAWEKFDIIGSLSGRFALRNRQHGTYLRADINPYIVDQASWKQSWEMYTCVRF